MVHCKRDAILAFLPLAWIFIQCSWSSVIIGAVLVQLAAQVDRSVESTGLLLTAKWVLDPVFPYAIGTMLRGRSARRALRWSLIGTGLTHWLYPLAQVYHQLLFVGFVNGAANLAVYFCATAAITREHKEPAQHLHAARLCLTLGGVLLGPVLLNPCRLVGDSRFAFYILSVANFVTASMIGGSEAIAQQESLQDDSQSGNPYLLYFLTAILSGLNVALRSWLPAFVQAEGGSEADGHQSLTMYSIGGLAALVITVLLSGRGHHPRSTVVGCVVLAGIATVALGATGVVQPWRWFTLPLLGAAFAPPSPSIFAWIRGMPEFRLARLSIAMCFASLGGLALPWSVSALGLKQLMPIVYSGLVLACTVLCQTG